jgi:3-phenylpropionate/trans-cinnamate dioxygenase ferredoxin subunit
MGAVTRVWMSEERVMSASGGADGAHDSGGGPFETVADIEELPEGTLLGVRTGGGTELCLFNYRGRVGAVHNVCTHAEFPLSDGSLSTDGTIECVWHGARYSCLTGEVRRGPAVDPVSVYEVRVDDGKVKVGGRKS